jgi:hypothetical protein|tara:strand:+ start:438 stop:746 length:309 start_codon:yes stop_codon:yes gene_type:complete
MKVNFDDGQNPAEMNKDLTKEVETDSELKGLIVNYVGTKKQPENDEVTLQLVLDTFSEEFPEFVLPLAEENFIRGYNQALFDVDQGNMAMQELQNKEENDQT